MAVLPDMMAPCSAIAVLVAIGVQHLSAAPRPGVHSGQMLSQLFVAPLSDSRHGRRNCVEVTLFLRPPLPLPWGLMA
jgi:hypothetical protein